MKFRLVRSGKYILLLCLLLCFGYILSVNTEISGYYTPVIYDTDGFSFESVKAMREEESDEIWSWTAVQTLDNQDFSNEILNREATGKLLLINGNSSNLISGTGELMSDDLTGCILSTEAAWELFGETDVSGGEIICNEVTYEVRGVYEDSKFVILLPAETYYAENSPKNIDLSELSDENSLTDNEEAEEAEFDMIVAMPNASLTDAQRNEAIETFETIYAVGEDKTDCMIYRRLAGTFATLIPALVLICIVFSGIINLVKIRRKIVRLIIGCAILAAVIAMFFILFQIKPSFPSDLIPNTWSDFDFWKEKLTDFTASIRHILFSDKSEIELRFFKPLVRLGAFTGVGFILSVLTLSAFRTKESNRQVSHEIVQKEVKETVIKRTEAVITETKNTGKRTKTAIAELHSLMITMICTCVVELIVLLLLHRWGISPDDARMLIYLWPYFLVGSYAVRLMCPE